MITLVKKSRIKSIKKSRIKRKTKGNSPTGLVGKGLAEKKPAFAKIPVNN